MQPLLPQRRPTRLARVAWWPALAAALVPKCPMCVAAWLSAVGAGAGAASAAAIVGVGQLALVLAVAGLGARLLVRTPPQRRYRALAPFAVCALALVAAGFVAPTSLWPRLLALAGVAVCVVRAERAAAPSRACATQARTPLSS
jgi:hypothetical protein